MNPKELKIASRTWWVKPIDMLVHNWALIEDISDHRFTVYFFHDRGTTIGGGKQPNPFKHLRQENGYVAVVDSLTFDSRRLSEIALRRNDFELLSKLPGPWTGEQPEGIFFDARKYEKGIYSSGDYWIN